MFYATLRHRQPRRSRDVTFSDECNRTNKESPGPDGTKPYTFIRFGDKDGTTPYKFIRFVDIDGTKPYKFIGFVDIDGTKTL